MYTSGASEPSKAGNFFIVLILLVSIKYNYFSLVFNCDNIHTYTMIRCDNDMNPGRGNGAHLIQQEEEEDGWYKGVSIVASVSTAHCAVLSQ